jgi:hypothetical protein
MTRYFRTHGAVIAAIALTWQLVALLMVPTAACCQGNSGDEMANCPMHHAAAATRMVDCPLHMHQTADRDCHCPRLSCSQTDQGFLALFGPIGVLSAGPVTHRLVALGNTTAPIQPSTLSLAPAPPLHPPRA